MTNEEFERYIESMDKTITEDCGDIMFDYTVCNQADEELFYKQCEAIEQNIPNLKKSDILEDVDGTLVQRYDHENGAIIIKNDTQIDALYVISDFDLLPYFR